MINERYSILSKRYDLAGDASITIKRLLNKEGLDKNFVKRVCSAAYEAEINIVIHSYGGTVDFILEREYVFLLFRDNGPGIENITLAMQEGYSTAENEARTNGFGAGMGLSNMKKSSDAMRIESSPDGTNIELWFFIGDMNEIIHNQDF